MTVAACELDEESLFLTWAVPFSAGLFETHSYVVHDVRFSLTC